MLVTALRGLIMTAYWWEHHNPPFAILHGAIAILCALLALGFFADAADKHAEAMGPSAPRHRLRRRISQIIDKAPVVSILIGGTLFIGGVVGFFRSSLDLDSVGFLVAGCVGFYICKRTLSLQDV